jgi:4-hydroxy-tetrahydrodipicolinate synthase
MTLPLMAIGGQAVIGVATHWTGVEHIAMFDAFASGDVVTARELNAKMLPSFDFETGDIAPNPIPTKAMLRMLGHKVGYGRPPMHHEPPALEAAARAIIEASGLAVEALLP